MPAPYHIDLRARIVEAFANGEGTRQELADRFKVGVATVGRYLRRKRETGSLDPDPHAGGNVAKIGPDDAAALLEVVSESPDARIEDLVRVWRKRGTRLSPSAMKRGLRRFGITKKKERSSQSNSSGKRSKKSARSSAK